MRSHLLVRRDVVVIDIMRVQQCSDIIQELIRCSGTLLKEESLVRIITARSALEDVFHELVGIKNEITSQIIWSDEQSDQRSGTILPTPLVQNKAR